MNKHWPIVACVSVLLLAACEEKGPAERAGQKVDHAVDTIKNGGEEPASDKLQDQVDKAREKINDAADNAKK